MSDRSLAWKSLIIIVALFTAALLPLPAAESARDKLANLEKALDARLLDWEQSLDGARWEAYKPGRSRRGREFPPARQPSRRPPSLPPPRWPERRWRFKARMSARGLANATFFLDGRELEQAALHGESGTARRAGERHRCLRTRPTAPTHVLEIAVENRGFAPCAPPTGPNAGAAPQPTRAAVLPAIRRSWSIPPPPKAWPRCASGCRPSSSPTSCSTPS